ncbi:hypothetical protein GG496_000796 [Candidatus Fervidibacteria bacterium JGI MDM2 JNZ-1-D12]
MKHEERWLLTASLLTLLLILVTGILTSQSPCLGNNCITLATGYCNSFFPIPCVRDRDPWGNYDECVHHSVYIPYLCREISRTGDVWLYQCTAPPPSGAVGPHAQWMEIRTYFCGTRCRAEFVTKKP